MTQWNWLTVMLKLQIQTMKDPYDRHSWTEIDGRKTDCWTVTMPDGAVFKVLATDVPGQIESDTRIYRREVAYVNEKDGLEVARLTPLERE